MREEFSHRYGPWALVAGASAGLGAAFAEQLAARKLNLILIARQRPLLEELAARLEREHGVSVRVAPADLGAPDLLETARAAAAGVEVGLVVYNAAFSLIGRFLEQPLEEKLRIIDVNCRGPLVLADEFGRAMAKRRRGGILLMSSLAGARGSPLVATYAATKAFNLVLAESLWDELADDGIDVLACRAGATRTPGYETSKPQGKVPLMEPAPVVAQALAALGRKPSMVPGLFNAIADFFLSRILSRRAAIHIMSRATRKLYPPTLR